MYTADERQRPYQNSIEIDNNRDSIKANRLMMVVFAIILSIFIVGVAWTAKQERDYNMNQCEIMLYEKLTGDSYPFSYERNISD